MTLSARNCWCKNESLEHFHDVYWRCPKCDTIVLGMVEPGLSGPVTNDEKDFYGKQYYQDYVVNKRGFPTIEQRARLDLPERCLHWLRTTLRAKLPPGKLLELGSAHGGFVALTRWSGFDSIGLEMSPWLVELSKRSFGVEVLTGPIESQVLAKGTFDVICLFDVLEHFIDPVSTMTRCADLLKPEGVFIIQTPCYPTGSTYDSLVQFKQDFPLQLKPEEHIYLFSERAVRKFFEVLGFHYVTFETAIFANYDMFFVASRTAVRRNPDALVTDALLRTPSGRLVQALIDLDDRNPRVKR